MITAARIYRKMLHRHDRCPVNFCPVRIYRWSVHRASFSSTALTLRLPLGTQAEGRCNVCGRQAGAETPAVPKSSASAERGPATWLATGLAVPRPLDVRDFLACVSRGSITHVTDTSVQTGRPPPAGKQPRVLTCAFAVDLRPLVTIRVPSKLTRTRVPTQLLDHLGP